MSTYPLIRTRWSNEHLLAVLFFAVSLYQLPDWVSSPVLALRYILIVAAALILDTGINFIRYKRPVCAVSAAVTAAVLYPAVKGLPGWAGLLGVAVALIIGKHIWGGAGKNIFNPAVTAMFVVSMVFPLKPPLFEPSYLLIPALVLSLPFIAFRVFPGIGLIAGMFTALYFSNGLSLAGMMAYGVLFWGCVVITDPVTATDNPAAGLLMGFLAGFLTLYYSHTLFAFSAAILLFNAASFVLEKYFGKANSRFLTGIRIKAPVAADMADTAMTDLTEKRQYGRRSPDDMEAEEILSRIREKCVFGMGGAGFPTIDKIEAVLKAETRDKYLIINVMECDPGLIHDKWLMKNKHAEISKGIEALKKCVEFKRIYLITKDAEGLNFPTFVEVLKMPDKYPYGAEKLFVRKVTGIDISTGSNPAQHGVLVLNVQTVYAVYEAICLNKKADTRYMTVLDLIGRSGRVVKVKIGDPIGEIVDRTIGSKGMVFAGGGLMQAHAADDGEVVGKTTNCIAVGMLPKYKESPQCMNCGMCSLCCPMGIHVKNVADLVDGGRAQAARAYHADRCISCGSCSYICLAGRNLSGRMAEAKKNPVSIDTCKQVG